MKKILLIPLLSLALITGCSNTASNHLVSISDNSQEYTKAKSLFMLPVLKHVSIKDVKKANLYLQVYENKKLVQEIVLFSDPKDLKNLEADFGISMNGENANQFSAYINAGNDDWTGVDAIFKPNIAMYEYDFNLDKVEKGDNVIISYNDSANDGSSDYQASEVNTKNNAMNLVLRVE